MTSGDVAAETFSNSSGIDVAAAGCAYLVSASRDRTVKIWDLETGFCDSTISDHTDWVRCIDVRSKDGALMATSGNDQTVFVYDVTTKERKKICTLRGHEHVVESLSFLTSMTPAAAAGASNVVVDNLGVAKKKSASEEKHDETIMDYIASGARDRSVRLWSIATAQCLAVFKYHENWVRSVIIHPSGNFIITASDDRSIRVMDIKSKRCLRTIENAHPHFVTSIAMHHTLPILVSGSVDQTIKCWQLD